MNRAGALTAYLAACRAWRFRPGVHDCATFVAGWVKEANGTDYARGWRGKYRSLKKGQELLQEAGHADHVAFAAAHFEEIPPAFAQTGDLAVIQGRALGIVSAERVFVLRPDGLGHVSLSKAERAFRV
jgi:hypothetical protein